MAKDPQHDVMQQYYELGKEAARLPSSGAGRLEFERTGVLPPLLPGGFTGFTHRPGQLRAEFSSADLEVADLVCVAGAAYLLNDLDDRAADEGAWQVILDAARAYERVPELLGLGSHLLATGFRR